jgi:glycosyltransferase involved in cell wall biosynthesis
VLIPCYDLGRFLPEAVESILAQTYDRYELLVVDDGSTDVETLRLLERYRDHGIGVLRKEHSGLSATKNAGIEAARGEYVVFVDADDALMPHFLERTVPKLDELADVGVVTTSAEIFGRRRGTYQPPPHDLVTLLWRNVVAGSGSLFRRVCWEQIGGYAVDGVEDWNFWIGLVEHGWRWEVVPETLYRFRLRRGSLSDQAKDRRADLLRELVRRHEPTYQAHVAEIVIQMDRALRERRQIWPLPWIRWLLGRV